MLRAYVLQGALVVTTAILAWRLQGSEVAWAALYGGVTALANIGMLLSRWFRGRHAYHADVGRHLKQFHRSSLERFILVGTMLATGLAGFRLEPLPLLLGLIVGQFAWMFAMLALKID